MTDIAELLTTAGTWEVDQRRSAIRFACASGWGLFTVRGEFTRFEGGGEITSTGKAFGTLTIEVASLRTGIGRRDRHLTSPDFFDAAACPTIAATVDVRAAAGGDTVDLQVQVTIKSETRNLELPAQVTALHDGTIRVTTETTVDRHDFGVDGNMLGMVAAEAGVSADVVFTPR